MILEVLLPTTTVVSVIDEGALPDRLNDEPAGAWADEQLVIPDELFGAKPTEPAADPLRPGHFSDTGLTLPEGIWGAATGVMGGAEPGFAAEESDGDWWADSSAEDPPAVVNTPRDTTARRRPTRAAAPVARFGGTPQVKRRIVAVALVLAVAGLFVVMTVRAQDNPAATSPQQIDAAGIRPTTTATPSTVPRAPATSVTAAPAEVPQAPAIGNSPATTSPSPPLSTPGATTRVTTAAPAPVRSGAPVAAVEPPAPEASPAPTPTATVAPPTTAVTLPAQMPDPETPVTTRRPRTTAPEVTAPSTTVPTSTSLPDAVVD